MARTVLVVTDRSKFAASCQAAIVDHGALGQVVEPGQLAGVLARQHVALFDAESAAFQDDELLVALGYARALGTTAGLALGDAEGAQDDLADELCGGLVAKTSADLPALIARMIKRADGHETQRFEYVTLSPRPSELLAITSAGHAVLLARPCGEDDDGSEISAIDLADDATSATLSLTSGGSFVLLADAISSKAPDTLNGQSNGAALDGAKVGSRLRELRKAAGLTQAELARRTGIHRPNIARVEAGRHTPSLDTLARIAAAIGVPATRVLAAD